MSRTAVVLFNLGGPDGPDAVKPFLFNLFNDPAIIGLPNPFRWLLAKVISSRRAPVAREIYDHIGGKSPLLDLTQAQAEALEGALADAGEVKVFVCMRYWHPMSAETARAVKDFAPDKVVLLPLYPQYSTTTSASSLKDWRQAAVKVGLNAPAHAVCCYPTEPGWITAQAKLIKDALDGSPGARVLFSAHGLPKKVVDAGDPYQWQVEQTAKAVVDKLAQEGTAVEDWQVCYQSRVGPLEWIGPSTEAELERAGEDGIPVIVVPIAFVSEHSETLVELDIEYRDEAETLGVPGYTRVPAVGTEPAFIQGLAALVRDQLGRGGEISCGLATGARICPASHARCPLQQR